MIIPAKNSLIEEVQHRISALETQMKNVESRSDETEQLLYSVFANEHSIYSDFLQLINYFGNKIGYENFIASKHTPILDYKTKEPLKIGDKVENLNGQCGTLFFDDLFNEYLVKVDGGGHFRTRNYIKIQELYDYKIDAGRVECRSPHRINKRRW